MGTLTACHALRSHAGLHGFRSEIGYQIFDQVWNWVGKITDFGLKQGKGFLKRAANPHPIFLEVPPWNFWLNFGSQKASHCARRSLRRPWKLRLRIVAWSKPQMFCEESLRKVKFRAIAKCVGPQILSLESIDYFGTSEHYWGVGKK